MSPRSVATLAGWSVAVAVSAAVAAWMVVAAAVPYGVPTDAVAVLTVVVMALDCLLGCRWAARRAGVAAPRSAAVVAAAPVLLAAANALLSSAQWWFRLFMFVLVAGAAVAGAVTGSRSALEPVTDRRFSPLG